MFLQSGSGVTLVNFILCIAYGFFFSFGWWLRTKVIKD